MHKCEHIDTKVIDWPDGGNVEVCKLCGKSRHHWEYGASDWIVMDVEKEKEALQKTLDAVLIQPDQDVCIGLSACGGPCDDSCPAHRATK